MNTPSAERRPGPTGRPIHPFVLPATLGGKLWVWRYLLFRRLTQLGVLTLFSAPRTSAGYYSAARCSPAT